MKSKIRLALVLSLLFHMVLLFALFSGENRRGSEIEGLVVELVSLGRIESSASIMGDATGSSDLIPPRPAFPMQSEEALASIAEGAPPSPAPSSVEEAEAQVSPPSNQEEPETVFPEEPDAFSDPDLPPMEEIVEPLSEERFEPEPTFRLVTGGNRSGNDSAGGVGEWEKESGSSDGGAPQPTVSDALPGGIGGAGGGQIGPRFMIPSAGRSNPKPRYPESARAKGREGTALLRVTVLSTGRVGEALIEQSSGHDDLDRSAVEAVMKWTFLPARRGETPVTSSVRIPVIFALDDP
ncbi:energy transducer TonB [Candidatus Manganitrophus noduliformans]|uniref:Energy transducer TonB n=1 Tax=Candidatus Manganitrophus noduliformans TaxID=2606439 RepID=A0A7X6DR67_9BACT|nr:energy transducer TonB [Candidatus Manganitrophus noduliformans]NKE71907.1 energy transducer TonB [Candidatus Manganitrophus noduliformans]